MWPVGLGSQVEGNLGLTFGIPVGGDLYTFTSFYRIDKDRFIIRKYIRGEVGLDTGVGCGV